MGMHHLVQRQSLGHFIVVETGVSRAYCVIAYSQRANKVGMTIHGENVAIIIKGGFSQNALDCRSIVTIEGSAKLLHIPAVR